MPHRVVLDYRSVKVAILAPAAAHQTAPEDPAQQEIKTTRMTVPIPPPQTRRPPPDRDASSHFRFPFSLAKASISFVHAIHLRLLNPGIGDVPRNTTAGFLTSHI